jgi:hypothetical protein
MSKGEIKLTITGTDADLGQMDDFPDTPADGSPAMDVLYELNRLVEPHAGECTLTVTLAWEGSW